MAAFASACNSQISLKAIRSSPSPNMKHGQQFAFRGARMEHFGQRLTENGRKVETDWTFLRGMRVSVKPNVSRVASQGKCFSVAASWLTSSAIASNAFTIGTAAVLPFYALMVVAPKAEVTKRTMESGIPYIVLGTLYAYLLYLSWTPESLQLMFASEYFLPELPGMLKMFSSEMTLASAWIHLLVVDLFAARQVYHDGLKNEIETRHSVSLCLFSCPIGIIAHVITKGLTKGFTEKKALTKGIHDVK
ncbi:hypothetical protein AAC387_Pa10g1438 [Persea americana]